MSDESSHRVPAGVPARTSRQAAVTYDNRLVAEAARLYRSGLTSRDIAAQLGVDSTTVIRWMDPHLTRRRGPRGRADVIDEQIVTLVDRGMRFDDVADAVGMSRTGVRKRYYAAVGRPVSRQPISDAEVPEGSVSVAEAARLLGVSERTVHRRARAGEVEAVKSRGVWYIILDERSSRRPRSRACLASDA